MAEMTPEEIQAIFEAYNDALKKVSKMPKKTLAKLWARVLYNWAVACTRVKKV
jgi:hypothetical protein